jgi:hypothetical protein
LKKKGQKKGDVFFKPTQNEIVVGGWPTKING